MSSNCLPETMQSHIGCSCWTQWCFRRLISFFISPLCPHPPPLAPWFEVDCGFVARLPFRLDGVTSTRLKVKGNMVWSWSTQPLLNNHNQWFFSMWYFNHIIQLSFRRSDTTKGLCLFSTNVAVYSQTNLAMPEEKDWQDLSERTSAMKADALSA